MPLSLPVADITIDEKLWNLNEDITTKDLCFLLYWGLSFLQPNKGLVQLLRGIMYALYCIFSVCTPKSILHSSLPCSMYKRAWPLGLPFESSEWDVWQQREVEYSFTLLSAFQSAVQQSLCLLHKPQLLSGPTPRNTAFSGLQQMSLSLSFQAWRWWSFPVVVGSQKLHHLFIVCPH